MAPTQPGNQPFSTSEGMLAFCLYLAGCEFTNPSQPCFNLYDPQILSGLGLSGEKLWDGAQLAWKNKARGHVEWSFPLTRRTHELIKAYRDQREQMEKSDGKASDMVLEIMKSFVARAMLPDEAILRVACVNLKIRAEFMNHWKEVVPLLKIPRKGKVKKFDTTAQGRDMKGNSVTVPAHGVEKPGYDLISLNASPETLKKMGLA